MSGEYGLKLIGVDGKEKIVSPDDATILAAGSLTMSNSLEGDNTYGEDVALGGTYDEDEISVLAVPRRPVYAVNYTRFIDTTLYYATFYLDSTKTYYTRNTATGVMTSFSAGAKTPGSKNTWNSVLSIFPVAFWDKKGASTFSSVRIYSATAYLIRDPAVDTNFSLAGSASGSGGIGGGNGDTPNNIKDNVLATWYGSGCIVSIGNSCAWSYWAEVSFSSKTVNKAAIYHEPFSTLNGGNYANGAYYVKLYYGSAYHTVLSGSWSGEFHIGSFWTWVNGHWKGVTKIRIEANGSAQAAVNINTWSQHVTQELQAWGSPNSDSTENKVVYSIGNQGIATVDYMVSKKRYTI